MYNNRYYNTYDGKRQILNELRIIVLLNKQ